MKKLGIGMNVRFTDEGGIERAATVVGIDEGTWRIGLAVFEVSYLPGIPADMQTPALRVRYRDDVPETAINVVR